MSRPAGRRGALLGRTLRLGSLLLAGAGSLLFLALFILSSRDLDRQQQSFGHAATTEAWVVHQLAIQFQKLQRVLALAQTGAGGTATAPGTDPAAAVAIQADLLWSRIDLLTSGPEVGTLGALPETREVQAALRHALERLEHLLPAIGRGEPAAIAEAGALLAAQEDAVGRYAQDMLHRAPKAVRAVGTAVGRNPVSLLIPCHRALRKSGALGGYHWGLGVKRAMLAWETAELTRSEQDAA